MAAFLSNNKRKKLFEKFYDETGIQLTASALEGIPEQKKSEKLYFLAQKQPLRAIPEIKKLIEKYPEVPSFKNHLYTAYMISDQRLKAIKLQEEIIKEHPKYVFGVSNKILNIDDEKELERHRHLLGSPMDIRSLIGKNKVIHISEYFIYQLAAGYFEAMTEEPEKAKKRLETLIELEANPDQIQFLARVIAMATMKEMAENRANMEIHSIVVDALPKIILPQTEEAPKLQHSELEIFYSTSISDISRKQISKIFSLPRATLLQDLNLIVEDSIARWDYFQSFDYKEETHEFLFHALYFQGALNAEEYLNTTLNLLRAGAEFVDYWFNDYIFEAIYPTLLSQGRNQLEVLKEFVLEENLFGFNRATVSETVSQVALHQTERRSEVIEWYRDVIQYHLDRPKNKKLIDSAFLSLVVGDLISIRATELIPLIEKLYQNRWIEDMMNGPLPDILKSINRDYHDSEKKPVPKDIYEYYSGKYNDRKVAPVFTEAEQQIMTNMKSPAEMAVLNELASFMEELEHQDEQDDYYDFFDDESDEEYYEPRYIEPYKRETPKVSRNAPCPCGSGKKYKRCCINK